MTIALEPGIRRFLRWWGAELRALLPARLDAALFPTPTRLELAPGPEGMVLSRHAGGRTTVLATVPAGPDGAAAAGATLGRRARRADEVIVRLPRHKVLEPVLKVPAIATEVLHEVIAQEMDRETPFDAADVCFDHAVIGSEAEGEQLRVRLRVARRRDVAVAVAAARALGLEPTRVDSVADAAEPYNLLPPEERPRRTRLMPRLLAAAALVTLALGLAALYVTLERAERGLALAEGALEREQARAAEVREMQDRVAALEASAARLVAERRERATAAELIAEVTERMPDGHWLFEMRLRGGELYLFGFSPAPSELLRALEASELFSGATFAAPVVAGEEGVERFTIRLAVESAAPSGEER
ncbi:MAG TPA: PilN domain-containing protein [Thermohalobaculum sp.]|nr:PilN domain-containing protein [Thermohalobaculum sp.]